MTASRECVRRGSRRRTIVKNMANVDRANSGEAEPTVADAMTPRESDERETNDE